MANIRDPLEIKSGLSGRALHFGCTALGVSWDTLQCLNNFNDSGVDTVRRRDRNTVPGSSDHVPYLVPASFWA